MYTNSTMSKYTSSLLSPSQVQEFWVNLEPEIHKALTFCSGELTTKEILQQVLKDKIQVWVTLDKNNNIVCVTTTEVLVHLTGKRELHIIKMSGKGLNKFLSQQETLEKFARLKCCTSITAKGRKGWDRLTKGKYKMLYHIYEQEIL